MANWYYPNRSLDYTVYRLELTQQYLKNDSYLPRPREFPVSRPMEYR
jgi:hypothetical protein